MAKHTAAVTNFGANREPACFQAPKPAALPLPVRQAAASPQRALTASCFVFAQRASIV